MIFGSILDWFWGDFGVQNRSKIYKSRFKNGWNVRCTCRSILDGSWVGFGESFGGSWADLGPIWAPCWGPKSVKIGPKSHLKCHHFYHRFEDRFLERFGANLTPSWPPKPLQNESKLAPKSIQVGVLIWELFLEWSWHYFFDFLSQHDMAEVAKSIQKQKEF